MAARVPVSLVCVFNDPAVREHCLDRSVERLRAEAPDIEYLPVDNVGQRFPTAGAALNHGVRRATRDVVAFVHQDVYLHSLAALERAAARLVSGERFGVLGPFGFDRRGRTAGFIRDRVVLLGAPPADPVEVDSLDEVLFLASRRLLLAEPLTEHPDLAWHAYAVEYGLRVRRHGLVPAAAEIPVTHNSLTVNLARLDAAHRAVAALHPDLVPVRTTCGTVTSAGVPRRGPLLPAHRWRYRWARRSWAAHAARRAVGGGPVVLADIRLDVDDLVAGSPGPLRVFNLDRSGRFPGDGPAELLRRGHPVSLAGGDGTALAAFLDGVEGSAGGPLGSPVLLTNLDTAALAYLAGRLPGRRDDRLVGVHDDTGHWLLLGAGLVTPPPHWRDRAAVPLGMPAAVGSASP
ncbi:MAG: hypothetical protein ACFCVG_17205 [Kineosporiaceae bacterium]